jgi:hypothetical protein
MTKTRIMTREWAAILAAGQMISTANELGTDEVAAGICRDLTAAIVNLNYAPGPAWTDDTRQRLAEVVALTGELGDQYA